MIDEPVLSIVCEEPEGSVERVVRPLPLSIDNLKMFWEKSKEHGTLFSEEVADNFGKFLEQTLRIGPDGIEPTGLFWVVDDFVGVFFLTHIIPGMDALTHYTFFDGRSNGRVPLAQEMIRFAFNKYGFRRLSVEIPLYVKPHTFHFTEMVGFKKEGRKRSAALYKGTWFDVNCYGVLREEVLDNGS